MSHSEEYVALLVPKKDLENLSLGSTYDENGHKQMLMPDLANTDCLFLALLQRPSRALDLALSDLGITKQDLQTKLRTHLGAQWKG